MYYKLCFLVRRTSSKLKTELCFWGEVFEFTGLPHVGVITVDVYREPDRKPRKRDKRFLVGKNNSLTELWNWTLARFLGARLV